MLSVRGINSRMRTIMNVDKDIAKDIIYSVAYDIEGVDPKEVLTESGYLKNNKFIRNNPEVLEAFSNNLKSWKGYREEYDIKAAKDDVLNWLVETYGLNTTKEKVKNEYYNLLDEIAAKYYNGDKDMAKMWITAHGSRPINEDMVDWGSKFAKGESTSADLISTMNDVIGNIKAFRNNKM